jgi:hypothetical protein
MERQLDFFSDMGVGVEQGLSRSMGHVLVLAEIDDERLIAAIPESSLADSYRLAAEAGRRRLAAAFRRLLRCAAASPGSVLAVWSPNRLRRSRVLP